MNTVLKIEKMHFQYNRNSPWVLKDFNLDLKSGETLTLFGPSGCGKSTLLSLIAGLINPSQGQIIHLGENVIGPSHKRVMIFQGHILFPWKTALENVEFSLFPKKLKSKERRQLAFDYLDQVGLKDVAHHYPKTLSGGMQQRVGIARALAAQPDLLLLDEPFSSLDLASKEKLIEELKLLNIKFKMSMILVTHHLEEACLFGGKLAVMSRQHGELLAQWELEGGKNAFYDFMKLKTELSDYLK